MDALIGYLSKLRDVKLQASVFLVLLALWVIDQHGYFEINEHAVPAVKLLLLISALGVLYSLLEWVGHLFGKIFEFMAEMCREKARNRKLKKNIREMVEGLDIFELKALDDLEGLNSVRVRTSPRVLSLQRKGVIEILNMGAPVVYISLSEVAKQFMEEEGWGKLHSYKFHAARKVFMSMSAADLKAFRTFLSNTVARSGHYGAAANPAFAVYSKYNGSSIFSSFSEGRRCCMDVASREALLEVFPLKVS